MNRRDHETAIVGSLLYAGSTERREYIAYALPRLTGLISYPPFQKILDVMNQFFMAGIPFDIVNVSTKLPEFRSLIINLSDSGCLTRPEAAEFHINQLSTYSKIDQIKLIGLEITSQKEIADPAKYLAILIDRLMAIGLTENNLKIQSIQEVIIELQNHTEKVQKDGYSDGIKTGFPELDNTFGGFEIGQTIIIAASPRVGKTSLALNMIDRMAIIDQVPTLYVSLEMMARALARRMVSCGGGLRASDIKFGRLSDDDWSRFTAKCIEIGNGKLWMIDTPVKNITELFGLMRMAILRFGIKVIFIDHIQLLKSGLNESEYQELKRITDGMKMFAMANRIVMIGLSQLSRAYENRGGMPKLSDLRGSGSIEADSDNVIFIHRERDPNKEGSLLEEGYFIIAKQRDGESGKFIKIHFDSAQTRFYECDWPDRPTGPENGISRKTSKSHTKDYSERIRQD